MVISAANFIDFAVARIGGDMNAMLPSAQYTNIRYAVVSASGYPTLNLRVAEPGDSLEKQQFGHDMRIHSLFAV